VVAGACIWALLEIVLPPRATRASALPAYVTTGTFTSAHPTASAAIKDFIDLHPEHPVQPIAYTHTVHLAKGLPCTFVTSAWIRGQSRAFPA